MRLPYSLRLKVPHAHPDIYARAIEWIGSQDKDIVSAEGAHGISYINGVIYVTELGFKHEEDRTVFVLMFPEFI
jgi:hypothetical protein